MKQKPTVPTAKLHWIGLAAISGLILYGETAAVTPSFWNVRTQVSFSEGELTNIAVNSRGQVTLSPPLNLVTDTGELYVWAISRDPQGTIFAGTGNDGKIFKQEKGEDAFFPYCDLDEPDVLSLAFGTDGSIYAGTSVTGTIYKIDPSGDSSVFFETGDRYVWNMVAGEDGDIYAGTGDKGRIYRISSAGEGSVFFDSPETHIMSLIRGRGEEGILYAGGEGRGIVYKLTAQGESFVLYEAGEKEVSALALGWDGTLYVGATSGTGPGPQTGPTPASPRVPSPDEPRSSDLRGSAASATDSAGAPTEAISLPVPVDAAAAQASAGPPSPPAQAVQARGPRPTGPGAGSALYTIAADGVVTEVWRSNDAVLLSLAVADDGDVVIGTGNKGNFYSVDTREDRWEVLAQSAESQVTTMLALDSGEMLVGTANMGKLFAMGPGYASEGTLESLTHDASSWSKWGRLSWDGRQPQGTRVQLSTRSGNTSEPDSSWSPWSGAGAIGSHSISSPNARFVQWRAQLGSSKSARTPLIRQVSLSYQQRNTKPKVTSVSIVPASGNAASGSSGGARSRQSQPGKKTRSSGSQASPAKPVSGVWTITWQADDANGDRLRHSLHFREFDGDDEWKVLKEDLEVATYSLDSTALPDGLYVIKAVTSDDRSNSSETALSGERMSDPFLIDNTAPELQDIDVDRAGDVAAVTGSARDRTGPLRRGYYAVNGGEWLPFFPTDEIFDSSEEEFTFRVDIPEGNKATLVVRVSDLAGNVGVRRFVVLP